MGDIRVSPKHGLNPTLLVCPCCGQDTGALALCGMLPGDKEARKYNKDLNPCDSCAKQFDEYKEKGFVVFIIDDEYEKEVERVNRQYYSAEIRKKHQPSPWVFYHGLSVIKKKAVDRIFKDMDSSKGAAFMSKSLAKQTGILKEES